MKKAIIVFGLFVFNLVLAQEVKWLTFDEALAAQKIKPKNLSRCICTLVWSV